MDSESESSDHGAQDTSRLRKSVSIAIRQLHLQPQPTRAHSDEIPESDEGEAEDHGNDNHNDNDSDNSDGGNHSDDKVSNKNSSAGSHYSPSATSSEADLALPDDHYSLQAEPNNTLQTKPTFPPPQRPKQPPLTPYSTVPPTPTHWSSPRKRSLSPPHPDPAAWISSPRPFKRHKSGPFNHAYLALLNDDIRDAAARFTPPLAVATTAAHDLAPSQVGLTHWSEAEKMLFFEALARVPGDDVAGIAERVRTKGAVEVGAYLSLLREEAAVSTGVVPPAAAEIPAAVEVSQACCAALEEAADAVSVRQENHEEGVEKGRWGPRGWLVGVENRREVESAPPAGMEGPLGLLRVRNWLRLSERVFMNSVVEEYNWMRVEGETPAVRATALEDFHALAVGVTRRLVAATIFVGESRVKARRELFQGTRSRVWKQDVEAAALSLGLPTDSREFWAKSARRLRLDVYDNENEGAAGWDGEEAEQGPMSYDEVEKALGLEVERPEGDAISGEEAESSSEEDDMMHDDIASAYESDNGSVELDAGGLYASEYEEPPPEEDKAEKEAVTREMNEVLVHSALEYPRSGKPRTALRNRIRAERAHEAYADAVDARASYNEEKRLWAMLERHPPRELVRVDVTEEPKFTRRSVDHLVKGAARTPGDWRSKLEVVPSRWEMEYALVEEEKKEKAKAATRAESGDEI